LIKKLEGLKKQFEQTGSKGLTGFNTELENYVDDVNFAGEAAKNMTNQLTEAGINGEDAAKISETASKAAKAKVEQTDANEKFN
jgi:flagellar hook-basal body complex protein FliE